MFKNQGNIGLINSESEIQWIDTFFSRTPAMLDL